MARKLLIYPSKLGISTPNKLGTKLDTMVQLGLSAGLFAFGFGSLFDFIALSCV